MGLFSFTQEIAMDLGTANTIITTNGKIVVDEPSVVALDRRTDKMIAVGDKAKMMHENQINVAPAGMLGRVAHGTQLHFGTARRNPDYHAE